MTSTPDFLRDLLSELIALFNEQQTDLPHMAIHKDCVFRLNGTAYHEQLGRPPTDPLVRLMGCGPAAYRLLLAGLRYALEAPVLDEVVAIDPDDCPPHTASLRATLTGRLRGTDQRLKALLHLTATAALDGQIRELAVTMGDADVNLILQARRAG